VTVRVDEETMTVTAAEEMRTGRGAAMLWAGILLPPLAVLTALEGAYLLVPWACQRGRHAVVWLGLLPGIAMLAVGWISAARVRAAMGEGLDRHVTRADPGIALDPTPSRVRLMATAGVLSGVLCLILLLALMVPIALLHPCD
jgi:hypothetical protein